VNAQTKRVEALREALGGAHPLAVDKVKDHLEPYVRAFIENAPFAILSTSDSLGNCDASPKGGLPGFVKVIDDQTVLLPDIGGNRLFQSYENFESNPKAGLLFLIPGMNVTARINGRVSVIDREGMVDRGVEPELAWTDENSSVVQGILIDIDEAYFHCPRSMNFANLWDAETIEANSKISIKGLKKD
jgi:PPOX class probable FMN-dependent enzyme